MATRHTQAPDIPPVPPTGGQKYPWDEWADGAWWEVKRGEDFDTKPSSFRSILGNRAAHTGQRVTVRVRGDVVIFQFRPHEG
jgi:hypothetical protein